MKSAGENKKTIPIFLICAVALLAISVFFISINKRIDPDEFEHIHSAWYVKNGYIPYLDFYQCHNPFFWYLIAPLLHVFGESMETVIKLRALMFMFTMGITFLTYLISKKASGSKETGLLSAALLLSMALFVNKSVEIRPDVPQVFFGLISICFLLDFFQRDKDRSMICSGIAAALSFLFLQKAAVLLAAFSLIFIYKLLDRKIRARALIYFAGSCFLPIACFFVYLLASGSYNDYIMGNWVRHLVGKPGFPAFDTIKNTVIQNPLFWFVSSVSVSYIFLNKETGDEIKTAAFLGVFSLFSLLLVMMPYEQYLLPAIPLLSISAGYFIFLAFARFKLKDIYRVIILALIIISPFEYLFNMGAESNRDSLERVKFVIENTDASDLVYDGGAKFNLFRGDLHYFWYSVDKDEALDDYKRLTSRYSDYDICRLIESKEPKFVLTSFGIPEGGCPDFEVLYEETEYRKLYIRK
ncbi:MAG: glycosyltransferase family 39 protein [Nitrospirae bacterium]|nr:glycosyltransferase family 39 protein [Nitrospirota bacterium]